MKKVLIICDLFPPSFGPRMGYLCKYLKNSGWTPVVLTEKVDDSTFSFLADECSVTYINFFTAQNKVLHKIQWFITFMLDLCFNYKDKRMYKEACKLINHDNFSLILCSTYRTFPLLAAQKAAEKKHLPFIADIRDIIEQYSGNEFIAHTLPTLFGLEKILIGLFKRKSIRTRNQALRSAEYVTTISPWHVRTLKQYNPNLELIYNGFDPELFYPDQKKTDQFVITYTGRLLSTAMRDPGLLLEALAILSKKEILSPSTCQVRWYVDETSWILIAREAEKAGVIQYMDYKGYVSASEIPRILNNSSVLLLLTNRAEGSGPKGVMTTKFFESLAVEKPILCVRSDESYLEAAIAESGAGLAARTVGEVHDFLAQQYKEWKEKGYTQSRIDKTAIKKYSRKEQTRQFIRIFELLEKR